MNSPTPGPSLICWNESSRRDRVLVCIPWAGAGAGPYRAWGPVLGDRTSVYGARLAGRESRYNEAPPVSIGTAAAELAAAIAQLPSARIDLLGHCSGAIVAFEVARALRRMAGKSVASLTVVGQVAPSLLSESPTDDDLRLYVPADLRRETELMDLLIPIIEADTRMIMGYEYAPDEPLEIPITAVRGSLDPAVTDDDLVHWADETTDRFMCSVVEGADHLFSGVAWLALAREVGRAPH